MSEIFRLTMNIIGESRGSRDACRMLLKSYATSRIPGRFPLYTWLVRIAANEALMRLRNTPPNQFSLDEPVEATKTSARELPIGAKSGAAVCARRKCTRFSLSHPTNSSRISALVFVLRDVEELSTKRTRESTRHFGSSGKIPAVAARLNFVTN